MKLTNKVINDVSHRVPIIDADVLNLLIEMRRVMHTGNGVGLAAPQLGVLQRVIITSDLELINPVIVATSTKQVTAIEGCLSFPGKRRKVKRFVWVEVSYFDRCMRKKQQKFRKQTARIVQHEIDHLNGVTIC